MRKKFGRKFFFGRVDGCKVDEDEEDGTALIYHVTFDDGDGEDYEVRAVQVETLLTPIA